MNLNAIVFNFLGLFFLQHFTIFLYFSVIFGDFLNLEKKLKSKMTDLRRRLLAS